MSLNPCCCSGVNKRIHILLQWFLSKERSLHYLLIDLHSTFLFVCVQVGPPDMFDTHQQLIELRKQEKELEVILHVVAVFLLNFWNVVCNKQILNPIFQYSFSALRHAVSDPICLLKHRCSYLFLAYTKSLKKNNFIILNSKLEDMSWKKKASSLFCV